jgi:hypothetical protein
MDESAAMTPASSAAAMTSGFIVEPGSNMLASARLRTLAAEPRTVPVRD